MNDRKGNARKRRVQFFGISDDCEDLEECLAQFKHVSKMVSKGDNYCHKPTRVSSDTRLNRMSEKDWDEDDDETDVIDNKVLLCLSCKPGADDKAADGDHEVLEIKPGNTGQPSKAKHARKRQLPMPALDECYPLKKRRLQRVLVSPSAQPLEESLSDPVCSAPQLLEKSLSDPVCPAPQLLEKSLSAPVCSAPQLPEKSLSVPVCPAPQLLEESLSVRVYPAPQLLEESLSVRVYPAPQLLESKSVGYITSSKSAGECSKPAATTGSLQHITGYNTSTSSSG